MSDSLAEDVLARHVESKTLGEHICDDCEWTWPCDAYRLAVMVRDIEALCHMAGPTYHLDDRPPTHNVDRDRILAITKGDGK